MRRVKVCLEVGKLWFLPDPCPKPRRWRGPFADFGKLSAAAWEEIGEPFQNILVLNRKA